MNVSCVWQSKLLFEGAAGGHRVAMDVKAPMGTDVAPSPKQMLLISICGCTAMDVAVYFKKYRMELKSFTIEADAELTEHHPHVFKDVRLKFKIHGDIEPEKALEAVKLSQSLYCGVSAMISKVSPILYTVEVNDQECGSGRSEFAI